MIDLSKLEERVILAAVSTSETDQAESSLDELKELADTAGAKTVGRVIQNRESIHPGTYLGKGKLQELREMLYETGATGVICDDELSPAQLKNLEDVLDTKVMDRTMVILDIFASRANTREGKIQVELAQLKYRAIRLVGMRSSLSRLGGGIGTRGPGEKKLETDRRLIHQRIGQLKKELEDVKRHREVTRQQRGKDYALTAAIVGYTNAGTVEFILDPKGTYYFMEMNTRIQVEHGVTEMVTGTDLIIEQIRVAMGMELSFTQEDVEINGHAIECRINAEIPEKNFMPSPGVIKHLHLPAGNGVRVDTAIYTGYCIPSEYDSMIAKVIVHAPDRDAALQKMRSALDEMVILGINTNLDFQYQLMNNREFCEGKADTGFIERLLKLD